MFATAYRSLVLIVPLLLLLCMPSDGVVYAATPPMVDVRIDAVTRGGQPIKYSISFTNELAQPINMTSQLAHYIHVTDEHGNAKGPLVGGPQMNVLTTLRPKQTITLRSTLQESGYHLAPGKYTFQVFIPCYPSKIVSTSKRFAFTILN